jgi:MraZ protein
MLKQWGKVGQSGENSAKHACEAAIDTKLCSDAVLHKGNIDKGGGVFLGEYEHTIDDKGRLAIPSRFRDELGEGVVITRGFDHCLLGFPRPFWETLAQQVSSLTIGQADARSLQRMLFSGAADMTVDRQGRINIPPNLREYAGLGEQVIIAGLNRYFEVWSPERWGAQLESMDSNAAIFAQQLSVMNV